MFYNSMFECQKETLANDYGLLNQAEVAGDWLRDFEGSCTWEYHNPWAHTYTFLHIPRCTLALTCLSKSVMISLYAVWNINLCYVKEKVPWLGFKATSGLSSDSEPFWHLHTYIWAPLCSKMDMIMFTLIYSALFQFNGSNGSWQSNLKVPGKRIKVIVEKRHPHT